MTCPLCATDFEEHACPPACPMSNGCAMVRCPRCGYEFVEDGSLAALLRRLFRWRAGVSPAKEVPHAASGR